MKVNRIIIMAALSIKNITLFNNREFINHPHPQYPHKDSRTEVELIDNMYKTKVQGIEKVFDCDDVFEALYVKNFVSQVEISKDNESQTETLTEEEYENLKKSLTENCPKKEICHRCSIDKGDCRLLHGWKKEGNIYKHSYPLLGEYMPDTKKVVLYVNNIDAECDSPTYNGVLSTYIHELFHAYFHYVTEQKQANYNYIREIEEAMTEFSTLVFLRFMENEYPLEYEWNNISKWALESIGKKQETVGDLPAYGFGRYLYENIPESAAFDWINKYSERLGYIDEEDELVKQYKQMVCPCYPTEPDKCLELLRKILFATKNTLIKPRNVNKNRNNMKNNAIIESILCLLKGYKDEEKAKQTQNLNDLKYLLNQSIRQYDIPDGNRHLSVEADKLWKQVMPTTENIMNYHYKQMVDCKNRSSEVVNLKLYKGNTRKTFKTKALKPGDEWEFEFRKVFHEEHVVPVQAIVDYLINPNVETLDAKAIKDLLDDKLHICIILKEEDGNLPKTKRNSFEYQKIIDTVYKKAKITLVKSRLIV